jgi:hypothetical protein
MPPEPFQTPAIAGVEQLVVGPFDSGLVGRHRDIMDRT